MHELMPRRVVSLLVGLSLLVVVGSCGSGGGGAPVPTPAPNYRLQGLLSTTPGDSITDQQLADDIDLWIPSGSKRLIILTQCYGGNCVPVFAGKNNTAVASATSPGELATYGGYDDEAAAALTPGAGRTGQTVHDAGVSDKKATPMTGGGLPLTDFPLDPTSTTLTARVLSRHVLVYAGQPDGGGGTTDVAQRDLIKMNFAGQVNTTVRSCGGNGGSGWDEAGSRLGLNRALAAIRQEILSSSEPDKEQFILFVTDHGNLGNSVQLPNISVAGTPQNQQPELVPLQPEFPGFHTNGIDATQLRQDILDDQNNVPSFSVFVDLHAMNAPIPSNQSFSAPFDFAMSINVPNQPPVIAESLLELAVEINANGNNMIGDEAGEGIRLYFPIVEATYVDTMFNTNMDILFENRTQNPVILTELRQDTGDMTKRSAP